ncbi:MAG: FAD-dependent oxidoreductase [Coriobacteriales bacterium]|jgi:2,4-dienoyl-CoA reductase-like NADH-dependent reductase (Old Yellow Enzyme family)/thioredoxin reductase
MSNPYPQLFEKGKIGPMTLRNRGVMMPMATDLADKDGIVTPRQIAYYAARARGGVGMVINEYTGVDDVDSIPSIHNLRAARDYHISALEQLTDAVHMQGALIMAQIHHGGATSNPALTGRPNLAPSAVPIADGKPVPVEMTLDDIRRVQEKFVAAAVRCQKAGYDGVELHGAHGYLIAQFFSKYYNRRTDEYGGSVENRCRFVAEVVRAIREECGPRFAVTMRMCGDEFTDVPGFLTLQDGLEIARYMEGVGIDAINISAGSARNADANCEPFSYRTGWKAHVARAYKEVLGIPVIATGTVKTPEDAERMLEDGVCDFVGLGRSQLADPEFMNKAHAGRSDLVRGCIACLYCRERVLGQALPIRCSVNACAGREDELTADADIARDGLRDGDGRRVAVVGAGAAGMECAQVLARRGFAVTLYEREAQVGGTMNVADKPAFKERITRLVRTMATELDELGVDVRLGVEATPELVAADSPAGVFVAVGADPLVPPLPGIDGPNVVLAEDVICGRATTGASAVVAGSGLTGVECAGMLAERGVAVAMVERNGSLGKGTFPAVLNDELAHLMPHDPRVFTGHNIEAVDERGVVARRLSDGAQVRVDADTVVLALGVRPRAAVVEAFERAFEPLGVPVRALGDARRPGRIALSMRDGREVALAFRAPRA